MIHGIWYTLDLFEYLEKSQKIFFYYENSIKNLELFSRKADLLFQQQSHNKGAIGLIGLMWIK